VAVQGRETMSQPPQPPQDPSQYPQPPYQPPPPGYGAPPSSQPPDPGRRRNTQAIILGIGAALFLIILIIGLAVSSHNDASSGAQSAVPSSVAGSPSGSAAPSGAAPSGAAPSGSALAAPPPSPTTYPDCTSHACIVAALEQNLTGLVAQDESVSTGVTCYQSTVVYHAAAGTYSASCTVTYSDGTTASGTGNLVTSSDEVTFSPDY
jgi:hypothetical protein